MKIRKLATAIVAASVTTVSVGVSAKTLTVQSAFPFQLGMIEASLKRVAADIETVTDGEIKMNLYDAGEFSPSFQVLENVGNGSLDVGWSAASYWEGQMPGSALFQGIPFGYDVPMYMGWLYAGGGIELWREMYEPFGVVPVPCGSMVASATGWFNEEITSVEDLEGTAIRISGLGGQVLGELGMSIMDLPVGEAYQSLDTGRIGAVSVSSPSIDVDLGFYDIADYYYVTGWDQQGTLNEMIFNKDVWEGFSEAQQRGIEMACSDLSVWTYAEDMKAQSAALDKYRDEGVNVERLPQGVVEAMREASTQVLSEKAEQHDSYARILESFRNYAEKYDEFKFLSSPNY